MIRALPRGVVALLRFWEGTNTLGSFAALLAVREMGDRITFDYGAANAKAAFEQARFRKTIVRNIVRLHGGTVHAA